jgi:hypothetical protein
MLSEIKYKSQHFIMVDMYTVVYSSSTNTRDLCTQFYLFICFACYNQVNNTKIIRITDISSFSQFTWPNATWHTAFTWLRKMSGTRRAAVNSIIHVYHHNVLRLVLYFRQHCLIFRRAKQYLRWRTLIRTIYILCKNNMMCAIKER